ncbi:MAG: cupredoxin domain-containing protein [Solirubrobacteraceae bacterium]
MRFPVIGPGPVPGALLVLSLAVAGCGGGGGAASSPGTSSSGPATTSAAAGAKQTLKLAADEEGKLYFTPKKLTAKAGGVKLVMMNPKSSGLQHGIAVEGNGVDKDGPVVAAGQTSTVTVTLKPGKYEFYCPFDSHRQQGMKGTLTVT